MEDWDSRLHTSQRSLKVAVAQIDVIPHDLQGNLTKHLDVIDDARTKGADLLIFPELSLTGYDVGQYAYDIAMVVEDSRLLRLAAAAGEMWTVVGFVEQGYAAQYFNSAALLREGELLYVHRKLNLAMYGQMEEGKTFATGRYIESFELFAQFTGAILLCSDLWNPALVHLAALHGATVLLAPTNSSLDAKSGDVSKPPIWDMVLKFYSTLYGLPIAFANRIGSEGDYEFWGGSCILGPRAEVLAAAHDREESLLVAELEYEDVLKARLALPTVRDSNLALIHREVGRLYHRVGVPERLRNT